MLPLPDCRNVIYSIRTKWTFCFHQGEVTLILQQYDTTLLTCVLKKTLWNRLTQMGKDNIETLRRLRNEVSGHYPEANVDRATFNTFWSDICNAVRKIALCTRDLNFITNIVNKMKQLRVDPSFIRPAMDILESFVRVEHELVTILNAMENERHNDSKRLNSRLRHIAQSSRRQHQRTIKYQILAAKRHKTIMGKISEVQDDIKQDTTTKIASVDHKLDCAAATSRKHHQQNIKGIVLAAKRHKTVTRKMGEVGKGIKDVKKQFALIDQKLDLAATTSRKRHQENVKDSVLGAKRHKTVMEKLEKSQEGIQNQVTSLEQTIGSSSVESRAHYQQNLKYHKLGAKRQKLIAENVKRHKKAILHKITFLEKNVELGNLASRKRHQQSLRNHILSARRHKNVIQKVETSKKDLHEKVVSLEQKIDSAKGQLQHVQDMQTQMKTTQNLSANPSTSSSTARGHTLPCVQKERLVSVVQSGYNSISKNPFDPHDDTDIALVYTDLEIVNFVRNKSTGTQAVDNFDDLILNSKGIPLKRVFLEGKAGSGKTVLSAKLVTDWCKMQSATESSETATENGIVFQKFELCIPVSLYMVREETDLRSLLENCVTGKHSGIDLDLLENHINLNPECAMFVLDGLDEYHKKSAFVNDIIKNRALKNSTVVITSRPWAIQSYKSKKYMDRLARVKGFSTTKIKEYAEKVFENILHYDIDQITTKVDDLLGEIKRKNLGELAKIPLLMLFFCYLWDWSKYLPSSETDVYTNIVKCFVGNYESKRFRNEEDVDKVKLNTISLADHHKVLATVGSIACDSLSAGNQEDELVFLQSTLQEKYDSAHILKALEMGIISQQRGFSPIQSEHFLSFPHKSVQEYFMAYYIVQDSHNVWSSIISRLDSIDEVENLENVLVFIAGLSDTLSEELLKTVGTYIYSSSNRVKERYMRIFKRLWTIFMEALGGDKCVMINSTNHKGHFCIKNAACSGLEITLYSVYLSDALWSDLFACLSQIGCTFRLFIHDCTGIKTLQAPPLQCVSSATFDNIPLSSTNWQGLLSYLEMSKHLSQVNIFTPKPLVIALPLESRIKTIQISGFFDVSPKQILVGYKIFYLTSSIPSEFYETSDTDCSKQSGNTWMKLPTKSRLTYVDSAYKNGILSLDIGTLFMSFEVGPKIEPWQVTFDLSESKICSPVSIMKEVDIRGIGKNCLQLGHFLDSLKVAQLLESLTMQSDDECGLSLSLPVLPNLTTLKLHGGIMSDRIFVKSLQNAPNVQSLTLSNCSEVNFSFLPSLLPAVEILSLSNIEMTPINWQNFFQMLEMLSQLHTVTIKNCFGMKCCKKMLPKLKKLTKLHMHSDLSSNKCIKFLKKMPSLTEVTLTTTDLKCVAGLELPKWKNLRKLELGQYELDQVHIHIEEDRGCSTNVQYHPLKTVVKGITMAATDWGIFFNSFSNLPQLKELTIENCCGMKGSKPVLPCLPHLRTLKIESDLDGSDVESITTSLVNTPKIENIAVNSSISLRELEFTDGLQFPRSESIKKLIDISCCYEKVCVIQVTPAEVYLNEILMPSEKWKHCIDSLQNMPQLKRITMKNCSGMVGSDVKLPHLPFLKELNLHSDMDLGCWELFIKSVENAPAIEFIVFKSLLLDAVVCLLQFTLLQLPNLQITVIDCSGMDGAKAKVCFLPSRKNKKLNVKISNGGLGTVINTLQNTFNLDSLLLIHCFTTECGNYIPPLPNLTEIALCEITVLGSEWCEFISSLQNAPHLQTLTMTLCNVMEDSKLILPTLPNLSTIILDEVKMTGSDWCIFIASLHNAPRLQTVSLKRCDGVSGILPSLPNLTEITLSEITQSVSDWRMFISSLQNAPCLQNVSIRRCTGVGGILPLSPNLTILTLSETTMSNFEWSIFIASLQNAPELQTITMHLCSGMKGSNAAMPNLPGLKKLEIGSDMDGCDWKQFIESFVNIPHIQELELKCTGPHSVIVPSLRFPKLEKLRNLNMLRFYMMTKQEEIETFSHLRDNQNVTITFRNEF